MRLCALERTRLMEYDWSYYSPYGVSRGVDQGQSQSVRSESGSRSYSTEDSRTIYSGLGTDHGRGEQVFMERRVAYHTVLYTATGSIHTVSDSVHSYWV